MTAGVALAAIVATMQTRWLNSGRTRKGVGVLPATQNSRWRRMASGSVADWLLDADPAIRWQVLRDLVHKSDDVVAAERARVATEGWGARLLALQGPDGHWGQGGAYVLPGWMATTNTLFLLKEMGLDPASEPARRAVEGIRDHCTWGPEWGDAPFFEGEVEPCINGRVLASGAYFGEASHRLVERLLCEQLEDGGWNCEAPKSVRSSFHTTICVLEGLLTYKQAEGATVDVTQARQRGQEYLLKRRLFRSLSTGAVIDAEWTLISYRRAITTTSCGAWTICGEPTSNPTNVLPKRSLCCRRSVTAMGDGRWKTLTRVRSCSTWKRAPADRAAGTRCGLCVSWTGLPRELIESSSPAKEDASVGAYAVGNSCFDGFEECSASQAMPQTRPRIPHPNRRVFQSWSG
jgi:hypothetical protein